MAIQKKSLISNLKSTKATTSAKPADGSERLSNAALSNVALSRTATLSKAKPVLSRAPVLAKAKPALSKRLSKTVLSKAKPV